MNNQSKTNTMLKIRITILLLALLVVGHVCAQTDDNTPERQTASTIIIRCATPAAMIYVDNEPQGRGECTMQLSPGTYQVRAVLEGRETVERPITVTGKENQVFNIRELPQLYGILKVNYKPSGSRLTIDGQQRGTTPFTIKNMPAGRHKVQIGKDGYTPYTNDSLMVEPNGVTRLTGQLMRLSEQPSQPSQPSQSSQSSQYSQNSQNTQKSQKSEYTQETRSSKRSQPSSPSLSFGVRAGLNMATTAFDDKYSGTGSVSKFHLGVTMDVPITEMLYFSTALLYSAKGYKYDDNTISETGSANFVDIPLQIALRLQLGSSVALQPSVGPYIAMGIGGDIEGEKNKTSYSGKFSDHFSSFDYGLQLGAQLIISDHFNFGAAYQAGMGDYRNRNLMISLGYNF